MGDGRRRAVRVSAVVAALLAAAPVSQAQPMRAERVLSAETGLSGSFVEAVAVDEAGRLWIGTQHGLDTYDGVRLRPFETPGGVRGLAAGAAGAVWAVGRDGVSVFDAAAGRLRHLRDASQPTGPLAAAARAVVADEAGAWIGTADRGVLRVVPGRGGAAGRYQHVGRAAGLPSDSVRALVRPRAAPGEVWVGTPAGLSRLVAATGRVAATVRLGAGGVTACADAGARVWCATRGGALHALGTATGRPLATADASADVSILVASRSRPGTVWVGTRGRGLLALDARTGALGPALVAADDRLSRADVLGLAEGPDGLVWIGTADGLFRADTRPVRFAAETRLAVPAVTAIHEARSAPGVLWLGTIRGGLVRLDRATGATQTWFDAPGDPLSVLFAVHEDARGQMWLGAPEGALVAFDRATGRTARVPLSPAPGVVVYGIADDARRPDVLWVSTQAAGLFEVDTRRRRVLRRWSLDGRGPARLDAEAVWGSVEVPGAPGMRWVAADDAGLLRLDVRSGRIGPAPMDAACRLGERVFSVAAGDAGVLWVGHARTGLVRYDVRTGRCRAFPPDDGARTDARAVVPDALGRVWMSTRTGGLVLVDPARDTQTRFTSDDGLPSDVFFVPAWARTAAGEILFGGPEGLTVVRPEAIRPGATPPRVVVTGRRVDGREVPGLPGAPLVLAHDRNDVAFEFAVLDLRRPSANRYRVRLDAAGTPGTWAPLGDRADVRFPYLAPGRYTLRVAGAGSDGVWAEADPVALTVRPPLWRRGYFWALVALAGAALVGAVVAGAYRVRIRQMLRLEATRRRIADDLHDDIGSKVSTVALRLDLAGRADGLPPEARRQLATLAGTARGVVTDLRDAVWFVDAGHDGLADLVDRIELATEQMCAGRPNAVERPGALPDVALSMERRRHVFLWVREALHNTCKHGKGAVRVRVSVDGGRLHVSVADAGPGFDVAAPRAGRGLTTLAARASALGGESTVESAPGCGTVARLVVPLRA